MTVTFSLTVFLVVTLTLCVTLSYSLCSARVVADAAEFHAAGLDERQWSERHSALLFLSLFRGLS